MEIDPVIMNFVSIALVLLVALAQSFLTWRQGPKWMLAMVIATYSEQNLIISSETSSLHQRFLAFALGLSFRFALHSQPDSQTFFIMEYLFVVLSVRDSLYQRRDTHLDHLYSSHVGSLRPITFCLAAWHDTINVTSILLYP